MSITTLAIMSYKGNVRFGWASALDFCSATYLIRMCMKVSYQSQFSKVSFESAIPGKDPHYHAEPVLAQTDTVFQPFPVILTQKYISQSQAQEIVLIVDPSRTQLFLNIS